MILAFKIILLIIIVISFMGAFTDGQKDTRTNMTAVCIAAILGFVVSSVVL